MPYMLENTACMLRLGHSHYVLNSINDTNMCCHLPTVENAVGSELVDANELHICLVSLHSEDLLVR